MTAGNGKKCIFCKKMKNNGFYLLTAFICLDCEKEITALSPDDLKYNSYLSDIKMFWRQLEREVV